MPLVQIAFHFPCFLYSLYLLGLVYSPVAFLYVSPNPTEPILAGLIWLSAWLTYTATFHPSNAPSANRPRQRVLLSDEQIR